MAPSVPEEVDVFTVPHSRMMELVNDYFSLLKTTNFSDTIDLESLLESLMKTFMEFKIHEQIENKLIMKRLKNKLKRLSIKNSAVCNCHKDNRMTEMVKLLKVGYTKKTEQDRNNYEQQLRAALEDFTSTFIPHMREEEEVFQPLLLKYFTYEELRDLKQKVIYQHVIEKETKEQGTEKHVWEDTKEHESSTSESEDDDCKDLNKESVSSNEAQQRSVQFHELPPELSVKIFSYLSPLDLCRAGQVNKHWSGLMYDLELWRNVLPVQWAKGDLRFFDNTTDEDINGDSPDARETYCNYDDDADIDESEDLSDDQHQMLRLVQRETRIITGLTKHVLPRVGRGVRKLVLSGSSALTNSMLSKMTIQTPNIEHLDLTQTRVSDSGLKNLGKNKCGYFLKHMILSGCVNITNATLIRLAMTLSQKANLLEDNGCLCEEFYRTCHRKVGECLVSYCRKSRTKPEIVATNFSLPEGTRALSLDELCASNPHELNPADAERLNIRRMSGMKNTTQARASRDSSGHDDGVVTGDIEDGFSVGARSAAPGHTPADVLQREAASAPRNPSEGPGTCHAACDGGLWHSDAGMVLENCDDYLDVGPYTYCKNSGKLCRNADKCCLSKKHKRLKHLEIPERPLEFLNLSGCFQITDSGLRALWAIGRFPCLRHIDLSGCFHVTAAGLEDIAISCPNLDPAQLYYCDNIEGGPFENTASGCKNLECNRRVCCRNGH